MVVIDRPNAAALSATTPSPPHFTSAAGSLDQIARFWIASDVINKGPPLLIGQTIRSGADKGG